LWFIRTSNVAMFEPFTSDSLSVYWPILAEGALVSVALGLIGCFLVVRGMSLLGDALSHSVLPGIVIGFLIGGSLHSPWILIGATAVGLGAAVLVQGVQHHSRVKEDASLGIVFTALFALGVVMINLYAGQADLDPGCVLYGNIEHFIIEPGPIWLMVGILCAIVLLLVLFYRPLLVSTFDPGLAISLGIPATLVHYVLMGVLSLTIVASFEAVGAILAVALLVLPGATARLWTDRMRPMLLFAAAHGVVSTVLGYWLAHPDVMNTSASGAICVAGFTLFCISWLLAPRHGLLPRARTRRKLVRTTALENLLKAVEDLSLARGGGAVPLDVIEHDLKVRPKAFARALALARRRGWLHTHEKSAGGIALTDAGRERSVRLVRAHELWEQFLRQEVGLDADHVHDAAEWIEHYLSDEKVRDLDELLARSTTAPAAHNNPT
ncbi:MAG: metal ABC transporter permease, partial [Actinomycetota bacterium]|nr:metal ABC transporter permease [Actinomycetota bacterium]